MSWSPAPFNPCVNRLRRPPVDVGYPPVFKEADQSAAMRPLQRQHFQLALHATADTARTEAKVRLQEEWIRGPEPMG